MPSARRRFGTSKEIVIDQSLMNKIGEVTGENPNSPETTYITMEGGLQLATAYEYLFKKHNLLIPGGSCWAVCAGGHVTGGGYGIYSVDHGTTCDYLAGVHFACVCARPPHPTDPDAHSSARAVHTGVDSTGKVRETHAWANSPEYELRQLLWACRGAMVRCLLSPHTLWPPPPTAVLRRHASGGQLWRHPQVLLRPACNAGEIEPSSQMRGAQCLPPDHDHAGAHRLRTLHSQHVRQLAGSCASRRPSRLTPTV